MAIGRLATSSGIKSMILSDSNLNADSLLGTRHLSIAKDG